MKKILSLILFNITLLCMGQNQSDILFEQQNINILLSEDQNSKIYLTQITLYKPKNLSVFWGSEMEDKEFQDQRIEFTLFFHTTNERTNSTKDIITVAYLSKDTVGYKIYETSFLSSWNWRKSVNQPYQPMSYEAAKGRCTYVGNSSNEELLTAKVWKYINNIQQKKSNLKCIPKTILIHLS